MEEEIVVFVNKLSLRKGKVGEEEVSMIIGNALGYKVGNKFFEQTARLTFKSTEGITTEEIKNMNKKIIRIKGTIKEIRGNVRITIYKVLDIDIKDKDFTIYNDDFKETSMESSIFGKSTRETANEIEFQINDTIITIDIGDCYGEDITKEELLSKIENAYKNRDSMYRKIAEKLVEIKNKYWCDEDEDKILTIDEFIDNMKLLYLTIDKKEIYMELNDSGMFGWHRIHGYFDWKLNLKKADF